MYVGGLDVWKRSATVGRGKQLILGEEGGTGARLAGVSAAGEGNGPGYEQATLTELL
jgi:hypothetical protein